MPKTIVVPLDGLKFSERALVPAVELAAQCGAEVVVVTVRPGGPTGDEVPDLEPALLRAGAGSARIVVVESRSAAEGIATLAASQPDPVVCMTTHARSRAGQAVFGSVAEELIRTTDVPIVFVGPSATTSGSPTRCTTPPTSSGRRAWTPTGRPCTATIRRRRSRSSPERSAAPSSR
jgi:nucleotide-binding universal stress UspA family protein